jgi:hypothetical protein
MEAVQPPTAHDVPRASSSRSNRAEPSAEFLTYRAQPAAHELFFAPAGSAAARGIPTGLIGTSWDPRLVGTVYRKVIVSRRRETGVFRRLVQRSFGWAASEIFGPDGW